jgi:trans-aconitate methyltransferase
MQRLNFKYENCLDFGCNIGTAKPYIFDVLSANTFVGTDSSKSSLEIARNHWKSRAATFVQAEAVTPDSIDLAFCNGVFHHIDPVNRFEAASMVYRSLRPGDVFAL